MKVTEIEKGLFCGVRYNDATVDAILKFINDNKIPNPVGRDDIHTTVLYSRKPVFDFEPLGNNIPDWDIKFSGFDLFGEDKNVLVMLLVSPDLVQHHQELMGAYNASWDWDEYQPHITLSYSSIDFKIDDLPEYGGPLVASNEYSEELDEKWED
jgi:hypothetical protein